MWFKVNGEGMYYSVYNAATKLVNHWEKIDYFIPRIKYITNELKTLCLNI